MAIKDTILKSNSLVPCIDKGRHDYALAGYTYNKDDVKTKAYTTLFCRGCGITKEILIVDQGDMKEPDRPISLEGVNDHVA